MAGHFFISYSRADGEQIALTLGDQLAKGPPPIGVWLDRRRLQPGIDWDKQLVEALRACDGLLFVMTGQRQRRVRVQERMDAGAEIQEADRTSSLR